ncbi:FAD/NAD(P)-binding domain-containing protein [Pluteus cervinus]|uniref:FAD/NAD(P)-binding domain-containing protein n=1 Tax=Pluteus cervinus TaxID=181527 RepID=A0ACD3A0F6_9AGAR|nr:FAD/NAD(P)-binding domain-containing protein [Pluteus cervinus]
MSEELSNYLPTLNILNASLATEIDAIGIASTWLDIFASRIAALDVKGVTDLFIPEESWWRDILALTWDFRTFKGSSKISQFLSDRLHLTSPTNFKLRPELTNFHQPFPDLAWVQLIFDFETDVGLGFGIARLVPTSSGEWKAHVVFTNLEELKGHPEKTGPLRNFSPDHGQWETSRLAENEFRDADPTVLIVGGGHSGLDIAARLKVAGISALIVEKNETIGDNWRNRYESLCLHDPVWYNHLPYLPFPPTWPVYTPAKKLAGWLQHYAEALELNVWTSSQVTKATQDDAGKWHVTVRKADGQDRVFIANHLIFATGFGGGPSRGNLPKYPGMDIFKGQLLHSLQHKKATDHAGKKVVVIGACTSAHDICQDYYQHGVDVTMFQRSSTYVMSVKNGFKVAFSRLYSEVSPPTHIADRLSASFPTYMTVGLTQRSVKVIAELDKDLLEGLHKVGFRTNFGIQDTGIHFLVRTSAGGYYLDTGASQLIADGKIKLKNDSQISHFTETGIKFENGSELAADVVVFATGLGDSRDHIRSICGDEIASKCNPLWGLNAEGELNGCWRDLGLKGLWYMIGHLAWARFHSKHVALQIKAMEEGIFSTRYSTSP